MGFSSRRDPAGNETREPANQATETGAGEGGARPARGDRCWDAGAIHGGGADATAAGAEAGAPIAGATIAGEWCAATHIAQERLVSRPPCLWALAATGTRRSTTRSSAPAR